MTDLENGSAGNSRADELQHAELQCDPLQHAEPQHDGPAHVEPGNAIVLAAPWGVANSMTDLRLQRISQQQSEALASPDVQAANLGAARAGLLRIGCRLEAIIEREMEKNPASLKRLARVTPAIRTHLDVMRQVDRFEQLDQRRRPNQ